MEKITTIKTAKGPLYLTKRDKSKLAAYTKRLEEYEKSLFRKYGKEYMLRITPAEYKNSYAFAQWSFQTHTEGKTQSEIIEKQGKKVTNSNNLFIFAVKKKNMKNKNIKGIKIRKRTNTVLSPYIISCLILIPRKGKATIRDAKKLGMNIAEEILVRFFGSKERAVEFANNKKNGYVFKAYDGYIMTDAQLAMVTNMTKNTILDTLTKKQKDEKIIFS